MYVYVFILISNSQYGHQIHVSSFNSRKNINIVLQNVVSEPNCYVPLTGVELFHTCTKKCRNLQLYGQKVILSKIKILSYGTA
jgi:hypothetical protein